MAACCYFGVDLRNQRDHNFLSRLTDGTPHSSSDLIYFSLLLPFIWTNYSKYNSLSHFYSRRQNYSESNSSSFFPLDKISLRRNFLFCLLFLDKKTLSPTPNPQKYPNTNSLSVSANSFQSYKNTLSPTFFLIYEISCFLLNYSISSHWSLNSVY